MTEVWTCVPVCVHAYGRRRRSVHWVAPHRFYNSDNQRKDIFLVSRFCRSVYFFSSTVQVSLRMWFTLMMTDRLLTMSVYPHLRTITTCRLLKRWTSSALNLYRASFTTTSFFFTGTDLLWGLSSSVPSQCLHFTPRLGTSGLTSQASLPRPGWFLRLS